MSSIFKLLAAILFAAIYLVTTYPLVGPFSSLDDLGRDKTLVALGILALAVALIVLAQSVRWAVGRSMFLSGAIFWVLPMTTLALPGAAVEYIFHHTLTPASAKAILEAEAKGASTSIMLWHGLPSVIGHVMGAALIIIGLTLVLYARYEARTAGAAVQHSPSR